MWLTKPEVFIIWSFLEKLCPPLIYVMLLFTLGSAEWFLFLFVFLFLFCFLLFARLCHSPVISSLHLRGSAVGLMAVGWGVGSNPDLFTWWLPDGVQKYTSFSFTFYGPKEVTRLGVGVVMYSCVHKLPHTESKGFKSRGPFPGTVMRTWRAISRLRCDLHPVTFLLSDSHFACSAFLYLGLFSLVRSPRLLHS